MRRAGRSSRWHYLAVRLPAPLPHLILDATSNNRLGSDLPTGVDRAQRLSLEGGFVRWFHLYRPVTYRSDALYLLPALVDIGMNGYPGRRSPRFLFCTLLYVVPGIFAFAGLMSIIDGR
ncbi:MULTISPECIES: hypothetical protein [unclassified Cryobacterium]|uniref:hypothetical protein n=1 Tax=unclassified Cryobacterium TaxID=2649013 RepID=UPI001069848E|nr:MULTISPECIES: hypothetical protein [unclassified Cryobacterium]TFC51128.1 hypothetical protein E3O68_16635 [Cryobacterium sp. TMB3-1-2]TFC74474.1 hypothetical protein E3T21_02925 [Cryobacterium sp. TMB3-15]TFC79987.1 hypothetical protein E3T22_01200 [Cryobacterium sp. TMB3-10]TFD41888.1 hypothetical protein E3T58_10530 [Cryobacterium sp. TMB3-12]